VSTNLFPLRGGYDIDRIGVSWGSLAPALRRDDDADLAIPQRHQQDSAEAQPRSRESMYAFCEQQRDPLAADAVGS
jgi:hypothetical protein